MLRNDKTQIPYWLTVNTWKTYNTSSVRLRSSSDEPSCNFRGHHPKPRSVCCGQRSDGISDVVVPVMLKRNQSTTFMVPSWLSPSGPSIRWKTPSNYRQKKRAINRVNCKDNAHKALTCTWKEQSSTLFEVKNTISWRQCKWKSVNGYHHRRKKRRSFHHDV